MYTVLYSSGSQLSTDCCRSDVHCPILLSQQALYGLLSEWCTLSYTPQVASSPRIVVGVMYTVLYSSHSQLSNYNIVCGSHFAIGTSMYGLGCLYFIVHSFGTLWQETASSRFGYPSRPGKTQIVTLFGRHLVRPGVQVRPVEVQAGSKNGACHLSLYRCVIKWDSSRSEIIDLKW